ncbi:MAG: diguanylate cyclase [Pseudomonadota bacterium]
MTINRSFIYYLLFFQPYLCRILRFPLGSCKQHLLLSALFLLIPALYSCSMAGAAESGDCIHPEARTSGGSSLKNTIRYYEDQSAERSLQEVLNDSSLVWSPLHEKIPSFGFSHSAFWLKMDVCASEIPRENIVLEISYPLLDHIHVFGLIGPTIVYDVISGDSLLYSQRPVKHRNFVFFLPALQKDILTVYVRVESKSAVQIPLQISTPDEFFIHNQIALLLQGLYFGIILAMVLYNGFLYFFLRERPYLFYVFFILSFFSFEGIFQGFFQQFLFNSAWLQNNSLLISGFITILFANCFTVSFLNLSASYPFISRILGSIEWMSGLAAILAFVFPYEIMIKLMLFLASSSSLLIMSVGCRLWWSRHRPAMIFTIAWSTLLVSYILASLNRLGLIPRFFWTENLMQIGGILQVILLSIALVERVNEEKRQRIIAEQRLSHSLEGKVQERTSELNQALAKLEAANTELSQMSHTDSLTQVANRRAFDIQLALEYKNATREGHPLALIMFDVDHFKQFNDTYGHLVGDKVLRAVAKTLKSHAYRPGDSIFRYGGEEFAVLLNNTDLAGALFVGEKLRKSIEMAPVHVHDRSFFVTVSAGLGVYSPQEPSALIPTPEDLVRQADIQLYKAKEKGRNRIEAMGKEPS